MSRKKVLAVGKDEYILKLLSLLFTAKGCEVLEVSDNKSALETISKDHPDLVLVDVAWPQAEDLDLCRCLKSNSATHHIPVVILDTFQSEKGRWEDVGADQYLSKPFNPSELTKSVLRLLEK